MDLSSIPSTTVQATLGAADGAGPVDDQPFVYNGSSLCPDCGQVMNPIQVMYGYGLCPTCQSMMNARLLRGMLSGPASERSLA